jgi:hypothetical protein
MNKEYIEQAIYERTQEFVPQCVYEAILELIASEREACAKIGDDHPSWSSRMYSATIRARGQA